MRSRAGAIVLLVVLSRVLVPSAIAHSLPLGFIYLRDIDPTIEQDIRYAGPDNFVGHALPGYEASVCVLREPAAHALAKVQADLKAQGLGLKVYDCYRPIRAVRAMVSWAAEGSSDRSDERFFPRIAKNALLARGFIAARSAHSTGLAVDLTLVARGTSPETGIPAGACHGPADDSLDMGTTFDCFDPMAWTADPTIGTPAQQYRTLLLAAMQRHGFTNYRREWWHFSFPGGGAASKPLDFPIVARPGQ
jgi:D-alanyl-D-alanine dipeptidase